VSLWPGLAARRHTLPVTRIEESLVLGRPVQPDDFLATDQAGQPIRPQICSREFQRLCRQATVPVIVLHEPRHTAATLVAEPGVPTDAAARWLGHDPVMLMRVYNHTRQERLASAGAALGGLHAG